MATSFHVRSNSLPSNPHPFTSQFDEQLSRLRSSESTSTSSSSIGHNLTGLQDLYDCVDNLLQLQLTQQSLAQEQNKKCIQDLLDGSLMLLDMCSTAKDSLLQIKDSTLELQSILRRRRRGEMNLDEIKKYLNSRKVVKKAIFKALRSLKRQSKVSVMDEDRETKVTVNMLKEAEDVTLNVLKSLLSFIVGQKIQSKPSGWSIVSSLMQSKRIACEKDEVNLSEIEKVDQALYLFISQKTSKSDDIFHSQNQLKDQEQCIQDLEEGIECISRRLIKIRVTLLNILNN